MKKILVSLLATGMIGMAATAGNAAWADEPGEATLHGIHADQVHWFKPAYFQDGRERAQLSGDSSHGGVWIDRIKLPANTHVLAHTHPAVEIVTVLQGTWYAGVGDKFDVSKLRAYPAGSFVVIPAGVPHFVGTLDGEAIVQVDGNGSWTTSILEK